MGLKPYDPQRRIWEVDTQVIKASDRQQLDDAINSTLNNTGINPWTNEPMWEPCSVCAPKRGEFWVTYRRLVPEFVPHPNPDPTPAGQED